MAGYHIEIRSAAAEVIRHLPPEVKRAVRVAIRSLRENPSIGEPLHGELEGRLKIRVRVYRIIYANDRRSRTLTILAVGHRRSIYQEFAERARAQTED